MMKFIFLGFVFGFLVVIVVGVKVIEFFLLIDNFIFLMIVGFELLIGVIVMFKLYIGRLFVVMKFWLDIIKVIVFFIILLFIFLFVWMYFILLLLMFFWVNLVMGCFSSCMILCLGCFIIKKIKLLLFVFLFVVVKIDDVIMVLLFLDIISFGWRLFFNRGVVLFNGIMLIFMIFVVLFILLFIVRVKELSNIFVLLWIYLKNNKDIKLWLFLYIFYFNVRM